MHIAIVGSGPAGLFLAELLTRKLPACQIDIIERLPTPFGLVRSGVAPDHQGTKNVSRQFEKTLQKDNVRILGNLEVGTDISVSELKSCFDIVIFATGASMDKPFDIPGASAKGVYGAAHIVGWYNAAPYAHQQALELSGPSVAIIGHGNVALDIARILSKTPAELENSDICTSALHLIEEAGIEDIYLIGRNGPLDSRFTPPELDELTALSEAVPVTEEASIPHEAPENLEPREKRSRQMLLDLFHQFSRNRSGLPRKRRIHLLFWHKPLQVIERDGHISHLEMEYTRPNSNPKKISLPVQTLISAIGFRSRPIEGLPFDHSEGRIRHIDGVIENGVYLTGWCKRGATGVIPSNRADALEMSKKILNDIEQGSVLSECEGRSALDRLIKEKALTCVSFSDWQYLDAFEISQGGDQKPREKITSVEAMLALLDRNTHQ